MTGIKTIPVNQSSEYKMENLSHCLDKIGHLLEPSKYKNMTYYYMTHGASHSARNRNNVTKIENHQLAMNKRMAIMHDR